MPKWVAVDIGCIECSEKSQLIGIYNTEQEAKDGVIAYKLQHPEIRDDSVHELLIFEWINNY